MTKNNGDLKRDILLATATYLVASFMVGTRKAEADEEVLIVPTPEIAQD